MQLVQSGWLTRLHSQFADKDVAYYDDNRSGRLGPQPFAHLSCCRPARKHGKDSDSGRQDSICRKPADVAPGRNYRAKTFLPNPQRSVLDSPRELLVAYVNRAVDLNEEALARLREESASGPVRLGVSEETIVAGLTPALKRFQRSHPAVELRLTVARPPNSSLCLLKRNWTSSSVIPLQSRLCPSLNGVLN